MKKKILRVAGILSILMILILVSIQPVAGAYFNEAECDLNVSGASSYHYAAIWRYTSTTRVYAYVEVSIYLPGWALQANGTTAVSKNGWWIFRRPVARAEKLITAGTGIDSDNVYISNDSYKNLLMVAILDVLTQPGGAPWDSEQYWLYQ